MAWWERYSDQIVQSSDLAALAMEMELLPTVLEASTTDKGRKIKLGQVLMARRDNVIGGHRLMVMGHDRSGRAKYRLEVVAKENLQRICGGICAKEPLKTKGFLTGADSPADPSQIQSPESATSQDAPTSTTPSDGETGNGLSW